MAEDDRIARLIAAVKAELPNVDFVLGYGRGFDPLHATPITVRAEADADKLIFDATCVENLATSLYAMRGKRIGIVVKGCDSRSVVELLQEKLLDRENLVVFGMPCEGVIDLAKVRVRVDIAQARGAEFTGNEVRLLLPEGETRAAPAGCAGRQVPALPLPQSPRGRPHDRPGGDAQGDGGHLRRPGRL